MAKPWERYGSAQPGAPAGIPIGLQDPAMDTRRPAAVAGIEQSRASAARTNQQIAQEAVKFPFQQREAAAARRHGLATPIADRLVEIVTGIEAGRLELKVAPFEPRALLGAVVELLRGQAREGVTLRVEAAPELPERLIGDAARLRQVLVNLVANALRFTARGSVVIRASHGAPGLRVVVEDTGPGISREEQALLFRPFSQLGGGDGRGSGVGLMLCRQLVEAMDGRIDVESEVGVGSRFWFEVPLATG